MKKVLSFVLVLTLVLGSFSMVFAAPAQKTLSDIAGSANEEAIQVVNDLGIITGYDDGSFKGSNNVTRAEFAAMITRALAIPESALAGYSTSTFKDTAGYGWAVPYLAFCQSKGIMIGDGNGNAMPNRTITVNEAMTMALRAVGYTNNSSALVGTWPSNYVTLGQTLGLYDDVATTATINRESAAQVIYNALTVGLVQVATDGTTDTLYIKGNRDNGVQTLLTSGLGCEIDSNGDAYVITAEENAAINLMPYQGAYAVTYSKDDEIVAVGEIKSTFLTGEVKADKNIIDVDGTEYKLTATTTCDAIFANGDYSTTDKTVSEYDGDTVTIAADLTSKTVKEVYSIAKWTVTATEQFSADDLDDDSIFGYDFVLDDDDEIDTTTFVLLGVASLSDIKADNVVEIYVNSDNDVAKLAVGTDSVTGKVTRINTAGDKFTIDGKAYDVTDDFKSDAPSVGDEGTAYMNYAGELAIWDEDNAASGNYAVYLGYKTEAGYSDDDAKISIKLYTAAGEEITAEAHDDINAAESGSKLTISGSAVNANTIIEYSLNKSGKINKFTVVGEDGSDLGKVSKSGTIIGTTPVASNVVVFVKDGSDYSIDKVTNIQKDDSLNATQIVKNSDGKITAILIDDNDLDGGDATYGVINEVGASKTDDDNVQYIIGFLGGEKLDTVTDDSTDYKISTPTNGLAEITVNSDGVVTDVTYTLEDVEKSTTFGGVTVSSINSSEKTFKIDNDTYQVAKDAVIYLWDDEDEEWSVKSAVSTLKGNHVWAYQTDEDVEGYDIILVWE